MANLPEDRGPSSLRVVKYNPSNPIHKGLVDRQHVNSGEPINSSIDARTDVISMPVNKGMEKEPQLSGKHLTNEEHAGYVVPTENRIKLPKPKPSIKTDAPSMKTSKDAGDIWKKPTGVDKEANKEAALARQAKIAAALKAKREGRAK
jgi:hypothetical protein